MTIDAATGQVGDGMEDTDVAAVTTDVAEADTVTTETVTTDTVMTDTVTTDTVESDGGGGDNPAQPKPPTRDSPVGLSEEDLHSPSPEYLAALRTLGIKPDGSSPRRVRNGRQPESDARPGAVDQPRPPADSGVVRPGIDAVAADPTAAAPTTTVSGPGSGSSAPRPPAAQPAAAEAVVAQSPAEQSAVATALSAGFDIDRAIEAILMVADEPQSLVSIATAISKPVAVVRQAVERLVADFDGVNGSIRRGFELREVGGGWRIYVRPDFDFVVTDFVSTQNPSRLSQAALETLAVIAYKQPITRGAIASIRAVNVDSVVRTLLGRGLITEVSTDAETHALMYGTTDLVLNHLGLNSLDELPPISPLLNDGAEGFDERL